MCGRVGQPSHLSVYLTYMQKCRKKQKHQSRTQKSQKSWQICLEMQVNEMHALNYKHHKVSSLVQSQQNTHNAVKYEVL